MHGSAATALLVPKSRRFSDSSQCDLPSRGSHRTKALKMERDRTITPLNRDLKYGIRKVGTTTAPTSGSCSYRPYDDNLLIKKL